MKKQHDVRIDRTKIHPALDRKLTALLNKCAKEEIYLIITLGFRSVAEQDALYAQGRTKPGNIVTNAKGSSYSSQHQWGIAFDIAINDSNKLYDDALIKKVAKIAKSSSVGLGWGGDWTSFKDTPHFYLKTWGSTTSTLKKKYGTFAKFKATWTGKTAANAFFYKNTKKTSTIGAIPAGKKVDILAKKGWYAKVKYDGKYGFISTSKLA